MKIRNGFVSNSSSSSFVLIVKKGAYEEATKSLTEIEKVVADVFFGETSVLGEKCMVMENFNSHGESSVSYTLEEESAIDYNELVRKIYPESAEPDSEEMEEQLEEMQETVTETAYAIPGRIKELVGKEQYYYHYIDF
jgi:hypothetical protein